MLIIHGLNKSKSLYIKKTKREKLNSAICQKNFKNAFISFDNPSSNISQPQNKITNKNFYEESKVNSNNNSNGMAITEREKNNLKNNLMFPLRFNNTNKKLNTERGILPKQIEYNNRYKNNCVFLTYKGNSDINKKGKEQKLININKFINEINSFLLPNEKTFENLKNLINYRIIYKESIKTPELDKLLKRCENQDKQFIYELFYKYIIKRTFKQLLKLGTLKNALIDKNQIKKEYQKQINEIKEYLKLQNKEYTNKLDNIKSSERRNKISTTENLKESRKSLNKIIKIVDIEKHKRKMKINQNNSSDLIFHIHNFDEASDELENQNVNYKNYELNKKKFEAFLSLPENNKIIDKHTQFRKFYMLYQNTKDRQYNSSLDEIKEQEYTITKNENKPNKEICKSKATNLKENPSINISLKLKKNNSNIFKNNNILAKNNNTKNKNGIQFKTEITEKKKPQINGINFLLSLHNIHNKNNNNNDDIINFLNNDEKMVKFTNKILNDHINKTAFKGKRFGLNLNQENNNSPIKEDFELNNISQFNQDNSETFNNSTNLENFFKEKDTKIESDSKYRSFLIKKSSSQKNLFDNEKFFLNENFFKENNQMMKKINTKNYSQLFCKDSDYSIKEEKIKLKNLNRLLKRKLFIKKKKATKERSFKDFLKDDISEENTGINQEEIKVNENTKNTMENKNIKINKHTDEEKNIIEKEWESKFKNFKKYVQKLKNMSKDEFLDDTLKFIKYYQ